MQRLDQLSNHTYQMNRRINFSLAFILCIVVLLSCTRLYHCSEATPVLNFVSFPDTQTDSIILRKYTKGTNFSSLIDSTILSKSNSIYESSNDTLHILTTIHGDYALDIQFDYEVYMPLANELFRINDFVEEQTEINEGISLDKVGCVNPVKSYTLNGQIISGAPTYPFIYLHK